MDGNIKRSSTVFKSVLFRMKGFCAVALVSLASHISIVQCHDLLATWEKFWAVSCEFKDVVSRSRRSVVEEPDLEDPTELFNYLYPLADVTLEDLESEKRSSSESPLSVTSWIEDLVDLWESECHSRHGRVKRGASRRPASRRRSNDDSAAERETSEASDNSTLTGEASGPLGDTGTVTPSPADKSASKPEKKVIADTDRFFAQYGGDIEYFFPLMSFGIPFDGEITFLGFHGFKGIFPYR